MTFDKFIEKAALPAVLATFIGVPLAAWLYDGVYLPYRIRSEFPQGKVKIITLYWSTDKGITLKRINGWNYWQSGSAEKERSVEAGGVGYRLIGDRVEEIRVRKGDRVLLRLISADVHHGFTLPAFGIGIDETVLIKPGDVTEVEFVADKVAANDQQPFKLSCTIRCGSMHEKMAAVLTVLPADGREAVRPVLGASMSAQSRGKRIVASCCEDS